MQVQADLHRVYGLNYLGEYRRGGSISTVLLLDLIEGLNRYDSQFWAEVSNFDFLTAEARILADIYTALTKEKHWLTKLTELEQQQRREEEARQKLKLISAARKRMRREGRKM